MSPIVGARWTDCESDPPHEGPKLQLAWRRLRGLLWTENASNAGVQVDAWISGSLFPVMTFWFPVPGFWRCLHRAGGTTMAKYITAARAQLAQLANTVSPIDPIIAHERPALAEFLSCSETEEGGVRELSVLMIAAGSDGLRVGLKDAQMGGWCWRHGATLSDALDALEVALEDGTARFTSGERQGGKKARK